MRLFYQPLINEGYHFLDEEESRHCIKVLRLKEGEKVVVLDGIGGKYTAKITSENHKKCAFEILESEQSVLSAFHIHIAIAPTKNVDRVEWFVEKSVEIGIQEISFVFTDNSERKHFKTDRIRKKAVSAMKQSLKTYLPIINEPVKISDFLKKENDTDVQKFIAYVDEANPTLLFRLADPEQKYTVLIGPEGDFSDRELAIALDNKFKKVSLGASRLRTETAGVAACHILNLINDK